MTKRIPGVRSVRDVPTTGYDPRDRVSKYPFEEIDRRVRAGEILEIDHDLLGAPSKTTLARQIVRYGHRVCATWRVATRNGLIYVWEPSSENPEDRFNRPPD